MSGECDKCNEHALECECRLCMRCSSKLELCKANEPWTPPYLICPNCDSTYVIEEISCPEKLDN